MLLVGTVKNWSVWSKTRLFSHKMTGTVKNHTVQLGKPGKPNRIKHLQQVLQVLH